MNVAFNRLAQTALLLVTISYTQSAMAQYFSSAGRSGYVAEFFIEDIQDSGIQENKLVDILVSSNTALKAEREYVVNCNSSMPQVVDESDNTKHIQIQGDPSSSEKLDWELWYAVCKKQYAKISKRMPSNNMLNELVDVEGISFDGVPFSIKYQTLDRDRALNNLVSAEFDRQDQKRSSSLLIYCEADNPTVYWSEFKQLVGVDEATALDLNGGVEERLVSLSKDIWGKTCELEAKTANSSQMDDEQVSAKETSAVKEIYSAYILSKELCGLGFGGESKLTPLKSQLKQLDELSKSRGINVAQLWDDAVKSLDGNANYQLAQLYKTMPLQASDRIHFSQGCDQFTSLLEVLIAAHMKEYSKVATTIDKDF